MAGVQPFRCSRKSSFITPCLGMSSKETPPMNGHQAVPCGGPPDALTVSRLLMLRVADVYALWGGGGLAE
jgi:hypothetical protein